MAAETTKQVIEKYIKRWLNTLEELEAAKKHVSSMKIDLANTIDTLGKFVLPENKNVKDDEWFFIQVFGKDAQGKEGIYWLGVTKSDNNYAIAWHNEEKPVKDIEL